jgi:hypothetical protein
VRDWAAVDVVGVVPSDAGAGSGGGPSMMRGIAGLANRRSRAMLPRFEAGCVHLPEPSSAGRNRQRCFGCRAACDASPHPPCAIRGERTEAVTDRADRCGSADGPSARSYSSSDSGTECSSCAYSWMPGSRTDIGPVRRQVRARSVRRPPLQRGPDARTRWSRGPWAGHDFRCRPEGTCGLCRSAV